MPNNVSDWGGNFFAGAFFGTQNAIPATVYYALLLQPPDPSNDGTQLVEPSGGAYARVAVTNNSANFTVPAGGVVTNANAVSWPLATADWGQITHYALCSASTAGNVYLFGSLDVPRYVANQHYARLEAGMASFSVLGIRQSIVG